MKLKSEKEEENSSQKTQSKAAITDRILPSITLSYLTGLLKTGLKEPLNSSHLLEFEPHLKTKRNVTLSQFRKKELQNGNT